MKHYINLGLICFFLILAGCATSGNIDREYNLSSVNDKGLVLFTVTHDKEEGWTPRKGSNIYSYVTFVNKTTNKKTQYAHSNAIVDLIPTSDIEGVWGKIYVWELDTGHYELYDWHAIQNTGVGTITVIPELPLSRNGFDVLPGTVTYIGNIHGKLLWAKNFLGIDILAGGIPISKNEAERDIPLFLKNYPQLSGRINIEPLPPGYLLEDR